MLYVKSSKLTESTPHRSPVVDEAKLQRPDNPVVLVNNF